jgi:hypothetical protein
MHQIIMDNKVNGMKNRLSKPRKEHNENLTGCLQKYLVLGYKRNRKCSNHMVLQILSKEDNFDLRHRKGKIWSAKAKRSDQPGAMTLGGKNHFSFEYLNIQWRNFKYRVFNPDRSIARGSDSRKSRNREK